MTMKKHHIHDNFIKEWLSDTEIARAFFEEFLPDQITKHLQLTTLQSVTTSYVTQDLKSKFSDLVVLMRRMTCADRLYLNSTISFPRPFPPFWGILLRMFPSKILKWSIPVGLQKEWPIFRFGSWNVCPKN